MSKKITFYLLIVGLLIISGCGRVVDWTEKLFDQNCACSEYNNNSTCSVFDMVKSTHLYDNSFGPVKFSALLLSNEVALHYAEMHACRTGMNTHQMEIFLEQWKHDHLSGLTFYVLSLCDCVLDDPNSSWSLFVQVNNTIYRPYSLNKVELSPEFKAFFGKDYTIFKEAYVVRFNIDYSLFGNRSITLFFRSISRQALLCWNAIENN